MKEKTSGNNLLNNTGYRRSLEKLKLESGIIQGNSDSNQLTFNEKVLGLSISEDLKNIEDYLMSLLKNKGIDFPYEELKNCQSNTKKCLILNEKSKTGNHKFNPELMDADRLIETICVLSKTNDYMYRPDSPMIFTQKRMNRVIRIVKINRTNLYEK